MKLKRILTGVIGFPIVALILIFGNKYIIDVLISIVALISMYEFFGAIKTEGRARPIELLGYLSCIIIAFIHVIPKENIINYLGLYIVLVISIMFIKVLFSNMETGIKDAALTLFGIAYIVFFLSFIPLIYGLENGKLLIWYVFISAWGTDTFAYFVGMKFGKHKFSKISPKKSLEGCIGGILGATLLMVIYTVILNNISTVSMPYWYIIIMGIILSVFSQIGDFSASAIKRTAGIKDFGKIFPGHGGMLDRIDSIIFIAPFAYFFITLI